MEEKPNLVSQLLDDVRRTVTDPLARTAAAPSIAIRWAVIGIGLLIVLAIVVGIARLVS